MRRVLAESLAFDAVVRVAMRRESGSPVETFQTIRTLAAAVPSWKRIHRAADLHEDTIYNHVLQALKAGVKHGTNADKAAAAVKRALEDGLEELLLAALYEGADAAAKNLKHLRIHGGTGSGNFGHAGRPGEVGGSGSGGGRSSLESATPKAAKQVGGGHVNTVLIVDFEDGTKGVYKPESGEGWDLDFSNYSINGAVNNRNLSLAEREVMASEVDRLLGTDLVPETVLRTEMTIPGVEKATRDPDMMYDSDDVRREYEDYREQAQQDALEKAGEEMAGKFGEAQEEHAQDIAKRADEVHEIWQELKAEHPEWHDISPYGSRTEIAAHPVLPLGTTGGDPNWPIQPFERGRIDTWGAVDPIDVLDKAKVDVSYKLSDHERERVKEVLAEHMQSGRELGDVNMDVAREHLDYGDFIEAHADTEAQLMEKHIFSFDHWKQMRGYSDPGGGGGEHNARAPHPNGGSVQAFVPGLYEGPSLTIEDGDHYRFAVLDYVIGSMDRHGSNVFKGEGDKVYGMDNGYTFPNRNEVTFRSAPVYEMITYGRNDQTLRTTPQALRERILQNITKTDWNKFLGRHKSMNDSEKESFLERVNKMTEALSESDGLYRLWQHQQLMR